MLTLLGLPSFATFVREKPDEQSAAGCAWNWDDKFDFTVSYHSQLFSSIQLDVLDERIFIPDLHIGRAECRISSLSSFKTKLRLPIFHHRDAPSRRPFSHGVHNPDQALLASPRPKGVTVPVKASSTSFSPTTPVSLGFIEVVVLYQTQPLDAITCDKTIESLLSPHDVPNVGAAVLEGVLRAVALSKTTRHTLGSVYRLLTVFGQGVDTVLPLEWMCGMLLLQRYFLSIDQPRTFSTITDRSFFSSTLHFKKYASAAYGWLGLVVFGKSSKIPSDKRTIATHLPHIAKGDILAKQLSARDVFQPCFFVARDRSENAIVVSIRGTLSTKDAITDLVCEYSRMGDGLVHRGIKVAAEWLATTLDAPLRTWIELYKPDKLVIVGHSLGAGTASLLTMLLADRQLSHLREIQPTLQLKCFAFAPPPACSLNLARRYAHLIDSFILDNDVVARLSYGSVVDLRTSLLAAIAQVENHATEIFKLLTKKKWANNPSVQRKFDAITRVRDALAESNINPKLYVAGTVYHIRHVLPEDVCSPVDVDPMSEIDSSTSSTGQSSSIMDMVRAMTSPLTATGPFQFGSPPDPRPSASDAVADGMSESIPLHERNSTASSPAAAADDRHRGSSESSTSSAWSSASDRSQTRVPIIERSDTEQFAQLAIKAGMFADHMPIAYEKALQAWLATDADAMSVDS
ncbi:hypothetical protein AMAG_05757 [Allomyces macrogynus ATCC 38327]|uniref:sn-1-specific diacylglycerol lipase n=1 Tax=Allomyces macrogynus (strain ATCC 38327) TaxID=578462 RepID=A0A0L0SCU4_ALLM3|nr:hypothetical protein AMAG_05757 [Allomyces macrogynus ATCC 38327]|eukprot:KNE60363.1 hypothetical protein AMAG_05757 [Allomyces macrogynus ATCC 38327]